MRPFSLRNQQKMRRVSRRMRPVALRFYLVGFQIGWEIDLIERPEIPVGEFFVEAGVEQLDVEDLLPRGVEGIEVLDREFFRVDEIGQRERGEDVEVAAMRLGEGDVADEGGFFEDVLAVVDLVLSPVDDGDGEPVTVFEDHHNGRKEEAIDLPGDSGEFTTGVVTALQFNSDEDVGFVQAALDGVVGEEAGFAAEFLIGELEEEVGGFPLGDEGLGLVERVASGEVIDEVLRLGACADEELVTLVAELGKELACGVLQRDSLEIGEGGFHGCSSLELSSASFRVSSSSWRSSSRSGR
jgi:hypothetical protein